ncbi:PulJ/GspJ family protein [Psychrobacillus sp. FSL K6-1464]|uniref:PulJ/GspJ family protein n=1 Tax=Psychrobacillus sp. FSL K6-1464 TaxID=2921545 RepID=UPI0030FBAC2A
MFHNLKNNSGFTLIEILASVVLLTVVLSMFLSIFPQMANTNNRTGDNLDAANVGKEVLVKMKKMSYENITSKTNLPIDNTTYTNSTNNIQIKGTYVTNVENYNVEININKTHDVEINSSTTRLRRFSIKILDDQNKNTLTTTYGYLQK